MLGLTEHTGSSPRTWGLLGIFLNQFVHFRFIPTCVGFTAGKGALDLSQARFIPTHVGFTNTRVSTTFPVLRFIPTHVGFTPGSAPTCHTHTVHPHARGVYCRPQCPLPFSCGSSPRTWGLPLCKVFRKRQTRFIPTHVGFTLP